MDLSEHANSHVSEEVEGQLGFDMINADVNVLDQSDKWFPCFGVER